MAFSLDQFYRLNRRALIWITLAWLLYLLRDFFSLIFLTFVLAFVAAPLAGLLQRYARLNRRISIILVYGLFLVALVSFARFVIPSVVREANTLMGNLGEIEGKLIDLKGTVVEQYPALGPLINGYMRGSLPEREQQALNQAIDYLRQRGARIKPAGDTLATTGTLPAASPPSADRLLEPLVAAYLAQRLPPEEAARVAALLGAGRGPAPELSGLDDDLAAWIESRAVIQEDELLMRLFLRRQAARIRDHAPQAIDWLWRAMVTTMLALLFSFLISLDLLRLGREVQSLRASRLRDFYEQTAQPVVRFAYVVGRAIQAQAMIACVNTALTFLGLIVLGIPSKTMLSLIVFLCSFIPVLGVFISTTPIVLIGLNAGGLVTAGAVIAFVIVIHMIEAYLLNPIIYGRHLQLNPVVVLIILFVGHHMFGLWGMLLGVPVAYYFLHYVFGVPVWGEGRLKGGPLGDAEAPPAIADSTGS